MWNWSFNKTNRKIQKLWPRFTVMQMLCFVSVHYWCIAGTCEKGQWLLCVRSFETFRLTVTERETFCDHSPIRLVLICIQSRDLHLDLTWDKICVQNANSWTFLTKLFFVVCFLFHRMHIYHKHAQTYISLWQWHYHSFLTESKFFHLQWPRPPFFFKFYFISDSSRSRTKATFSPGDAEAFPAVGNKNAEGSVSDTSGI